MTRTLLTRPTAILTTFLVTALLLCSVGCTPKEDPIIDGKKVSEWVSMAKEIDSRARRQAVTVLGRVKQHPHLVLDTLVDKLDDSDPAVRIYAVEAFVRLGKPSVETLKPLLEHKKLRVRMAAAVALVQIEPEADGRALSMLPEAALVDNERVPGLATLPTLDRMATQGLTQAGRKAVPVLVESLKHTNPNVRYLAGDALVGMGPEEAGPAGLAALEAIAKRNLKEDEPLVHIINNNLGKFRKYAGKPDTGPIVDPHKAQ